MKIIELYQICGKMIPHKVFIYYGLGIYDCFRLD